MIALFRWSTPIPRDGYPRRTPRRTGCTLRQPDRGAQLEALAHLLRVAGLEVEEHRVLHVAGLWIDDALAGARMPAGAVA